MRRRAMTNTGWMKRIDEWWVTEDWWVWLVCTGRDFSLFCRLFLGVSDTTRWSAIRVWWEPSHRGEWKFIEEPWGGFDVVHSSGYHVEVVAQLSQYLGAELNQPGHLWVEWK